MLVRFRSDAGDILMFGDIAVALLRMMGQSGGIPGAILASDIPAALDRLQQGIGLKGDEPTEHSRNGNNGEPPVSLRQRAFPLIELLKRAVNKNVDVIWQEERS
jgi:hypothetical protein